MLDFMIGPFILMYHSIADNSDDPFAVPVEAFRRQLSWLSDHGYAIVSLSFLLQEIQRKNYRNLRKKVVLTFDDGYKDFITNALPILLERGAAATVFLVTDMLGGRASWNKSGANSRLLSKGEVRSIKNQGISLGSHTSTHDNLTLLDHKDLKRQIGDSYDALTRLGESFYAFSYPWGQWSSQVVEAVKDAGYACAVAVGEQMRWTAVNPYLLPRIVMKRDMNLERFRSLLTRTTAVRAMRMKCRAVLDKLDMFCLKSYGNRMIFRDNRN